MKESADGFLGKLSLLLKSNSDFFLLDTVKSAWDTGTIADIL